MISWHWHWVQAREHDASSQGVLQARAGACILLPRLSILLQGLEVGPTDVVLHVRPCEGLVRQLDGTVEKRFAKAELRVPLQVTFWVYICDQSMLAHSACRSYLYVCWFPTTGQESGSRSYGSKCTVLVHDRACAPRRNVEEGIPDPSRPNGRSPCGATPRQTRAWRRRWQQEAAGAQTCSRAPAPCSWAAPTTAARRPCWTPAATASPARWAPLQIRSRAGWSRQECLL